eukprot:5933158-Alexandrium_andersonii.AAC.1
MARPRRSPGPPSSDQTAARRRRGSMAQELRLFFHVLHHRLSFGRRAWRSQGRLVGGLAARSVAARKA